MAGYRILVKDGYNIVTDIETARQYIKEYKEADLYEGMQFLPHYDGPEVFE